MLGVIYLTSLCYPVFSSRVGVFLWSKAVSAKSIIFIKINSVCQDIVFSNSVDLTGS